MPTPTFVWSDRDKQRWLRDLRDVARLNILRETLQVPDIVDEIRKLKPPKPLPKALKDLVDEVTAFQPAPQTIPIKKG